MEILQVKIRRSIDELDEYSMFEKLSIFKLSCNYVNLQFTFKAQSLYFRNTPPLSHYRWKNEDTFISLKM